ncbi:MULTISPECIES: hypothetical protein, partial [unclassified Bartonella]|uniref:hypothetical protein n=1 Tax=unclassified Bartonella TaxID=2645622 RepID=UPI00235F32C7
SHAPPLHLNASPPFCLANTPISPPHTSTPTNAGNTVPVHAFTDRHFSVFQDLQKAVDMCKCVTQECFKQLF